jgi:hypothetical protein
MKHPVNLPLPACATKKLYGTKVRVSVFYPKTRRDAENDTIYFKNRRKSKTNNKQEKILSAVNADLEGRQRHMATYYSPYLDRFYKKEVKKNCFLS